MPKLALTIDKLDAVAEPLRGLYVERDGKFHLDADVPDVAKLEATLEKVRGEKKDAEKRATDASERAADLQRQLDVKATSGADTDKKMADALARWQKDKDAAVKAVQDQLDAAAGKLRKLTLTDKLKQMFLDAGGRPERAEKAIADAGAQFDLADEDRIVMKDAKGGVTTEKAQDFFATRYKKEMPEFYKGTQAAGGGAGGMHPAGVMGPIPDGVSPEQRLALAHEQGIKQ